MFGFVVLARDLYAGFGARGVACLGGFNVAVYNVRTDMARCEVIRKA